MDSYDHPTQYPGIWLYAEAPNVAAFGELGYDYFGKWCITRPEKQINAAWLKVRDLVTSGHVLHAKVSGWPQAARFGGSFLICVYTPDWRDEDDLTRVRTLLRKAGFKEELGYKRDCDTAAGIYGTPDEWYRRA